MEMTKEQAEALAIYICKRQKWYSPAWIARTFNGDFWIFDADKSRKRLTQKILDFYKKESK